MEVMVNQWNEAESEVEEEGLKRRQGHKHSSSSSSSSSSESESDKDIEVEGGGLEFNESETKEKFDIIRTEMNAEMILQHEDTIFPASDPPLPEDSTSLKNVTSEIVIVSTMKENDKERQELYLERVFEKPPTYGFYCPNYKSCIQKVYIQKGEWEQTNAPTTHQPLQPAEQIRCSSCFSFLIPIGSLSFPGLVYEDDDAALGDLVIDSSNNNSRHPQGHDQKFKGALQHKAQAPEPDQFKEQMNQFEAEGTSKSTTKIADYKGKQSLQTSEKVEDKINGTGLESISRNIGDKKSEDSSSYSSATSQDQGKEQIAPKKHFWNDWAVIGDASEAPIPKQTITGSSKKSDWRVITAVSHATTLKQPEIDVPNKKLKEHIEVKIEEVVTGPAEEVVPAESTTLLTHRETTVPASTMTLEILKSIVYGGLIESLTSLSVVISAASAEATTLNIVALAIANLIGGLFVLGHNLQELKTEQPKRAENNTIDRYNELLGQRENFILHAFIATISFILFGIVPPMVYDFSFRESSDDKDFKLVAVVAASLLCVTLLSIAKAHVKRPNSYLMYFQTVLYYASTGAVATVLSYLTGDFVKKLMLGWF